MTTITIVVRLKPPTQNELGANKGGRGAWWQYAATKKLWASHIPPCPHHQRAAGPRHLRVTRVLGHRERAYDTMNLVGGLKPIVDLLVECGYLVDDRDQEFSFSVHQRRPAPSEPSPLTILDLTDRTTVLPTSRPPDASGV